MWRTIRHSLLGLCTLSLLSCASDEIPSAPTAVTHVPGGPSYIISDGAHSGGTAGFYFLPPMVANPSTAGTFDASFLPYTTVRVCELGTAGCVVPAIASFTAGSGEASEVLRVEDDHYLVNWHTDQFALDPLKTYRIEVEVADIVIGFADVDVVTSGKELKSVETGEFIPLKDGRTLPIKFRLEAGLPGIEVVGAAGGTVLAEDGLVRLEVPANALGTETVITMVLTGAAPADEGTIPGTLWTFSPDGLVFDEPVQLIMTYDPNALPPELTDPAAGLTLGTRINGLWQELVSTVDDGAHEVSASISGFSM